MPAPLRQSVRRRFPASAWAGILVCLSAWGPAQAEGSNLVFRTLTDEPGRLVLEVDVPTATLTRVGEDGWRAGCNGCDRAAVPGVPDLPFASLHVLTSQAPPRVTITVLESEARSLPEGMAPEPEYLSPTRSRYLRNETAWRESEAGAAQVGPPGRRGARILRAIRVPLGRWSETSRTLTLLRKARITVEFPVTGTPCAAALPASLAGEVANPKGGACFVPSTRLLAKSARASAPPPPGDSLVRITLGDADPATFGEDKLYALTFAEFIRVAPTAAAVPVARFRLYTGPADTLRTTPTGPAAPGTLRQIPCDLRDANGNGIFDAKDSIVFFGRGSSVWKRIPETAGPIRFVFAGDPASRLNSYWLDFSGRDPEPALRLRSAPPETRASRLRSESRHYLRAERDQVILACDHSDFKLPKVDSAAGAFWFWLWSGDCKTRAQFSTVSGSQLSTPETENPKEAVQQIGDSLFVGMFAHPYQAENDFDIRLEGGSGPLPLVAAGVQGNWYVSTDALPAGRFRFASVGWLGNDTRFEGYTLAYKRRLEVSSPTLRIFPESFGERVSYRVKDGAGAACLRIEGGVAVKHMVLDAEGVFTDSLGPDANATWLICGPPALPEATTLSLERPGAAGQALRNLADADGKTPEYLILAPEAFVAEALALAKYRSDPKRALPLRASVALVEDVYRQYSGGRPSAAALRDFIRWGWSSWGGAQGNGSLRYVLLLGDGHYDILGLRSQARGETARNRVPVFEWLTAGAQGDGVASDDYFALLDEGEVPGMNTALLDVAVGRVPANSRAQAAGYLAKAKAWEDPSLGGAWRSRITFAADDGVQKGGRNTSDDEIERGHTTDSDSLARMVEARHRGLAADKVYMVEYPLNSLWHKPEAAQDLLSFINAGTTLVNYVGHGSYNQWADEVLLQTNDGLARMRNEGRTPMFNAFSCTVGRFDDFAKVGLSELFVTTPGKGAIGAVSSARESYPGPNVELARAFYTHAFPATGAPTMPVGEALRLAKNDPGLRTSAGNSVLYNLLGEPVILQRKPELAVTLEATPDTLRALDCGRIQGKVEGGSGSGFVNLRMLSQSQARAWPPPWPTSAVDTQYGVMRGNLLFEGTFPFSGGKFDASYFIPRQIAFGDTNARILAYAWDANEEREGSSDKEGIAIQGVSTGACAQDTDGRGPRIRVTGCETAEAAGVDFPDQVKLPLPYCLEVTVEDSSGGVLTSDGPDDGTTIEVPGAIDPFHPRPGIDEVYRKVFRLPLERQTLGTGTRLLKVSARDGYGNRTLRTLKMDLSTDSALQTVSAYNIPNPAKRNGTTFYFSTIMPARTVNYDDPTGGDARVFFEVRVFDQLGRLVRRFDGAQSGATRWDGRDAWGNLMGNGVYFYQVTARQNLSGFDAEPGYRTLSSRRNTLILSR